MGRFYMQNGWIKGWQHVYNEVYCIYIKYVKYNERLIGSLHVALMYIEEWGEGIMHKNNMDRLFDVYF